MSYRQKFYIGAVITAGVCSAVGLALYLRYRRRAAIEKQIIRDISSISGSSTINDERTSTTETSTEKTDKVSLRSSNINVEFEFPDGNMLLKNEEAIVLTNYLNETNEDRLNKILTTISNLGTLAQNQEFLANAGCIERLEKILSTTKNETTQLKVIFALNNLALNPTIIERFRNIVLKIIEVCRIFSSKSLIRRYALQLLANLSLFDNLHEEFTRNPIELSSLIESSWPSYDESLQSAKILVNLSTNKSNIDSLFKLTALELKHIVNYCTPPKKSHNEELVEKLDELLLRFVTFYCNLIENVVQELEKTNENAHLIKDWVTDPVPHGQSALYFELFDQGKQTLSKTILRPKYLSNDVNQQIGRFRKSLEKLIQIQFDSSFLIMQNEFNQSELLRSVSEASTPKRVSNESSDENDDKENILNDLTKEVQDHFEEDEETILAGRTSPSDQSLASFRSALSINENNLCSSPEKSNLIET